MRRSRRSTSRSPSRRHASVAARTEGAPRADRLPATAADAGRPPRRLRRRGRPPIHPGPPLGRPLARPGIRRARPRRRPRHDGLCRARLHLPRRPVARAAHHGGAGVTAPRIDLRSDTLSPSTPAMFEAMAAARLGMASRGEDEHVLRLEARGGRTARNRGRRVPAQRHEREPARAARTGPARHRRPDGPDGARQPGRVVRDHGLGRPRAVAARGRSGPPRPRGGRARLHRDRTAVARRPSAPWCWRTPTTSPAARC